MAEVAVHSDCDDSDTDVLGLVIIAFKSPSRPTCYWGMGTFSHFFRGPSETHSVRLEQ